MPVWTILVGDHLWDKPTNQPLGVDWNQMPPLPQGSLGTSPPPYQDLSFLNKGTTTPLAPVIEEE